MPLLVYLYKVQLQKSRVKLKDPKLTRDEEDKLRHQLDGNIHDSVHLEEMNGMFVILSIDVQQFGEKVIAEKILSLLKRLRHLCTYLPGELEILIDQLYSLDAKSEKKRKEIEEMAAHPDAHDHYLEKRFEHMKRWLKLIDDYIKLKVLYVRLLHGKVSPLTDKEVRSLGIELRFKEQKVAAMLRHLANRRENLYQYWWEFREPPEFVPREDRYFILLDDRRRNYLYEAGLWNLSLITHAITSEDKNPLVIISACKGALANVGPLFDSLDDYPMQKMNVKFEYKPLRILKPRVDIETIGKPEPHPNIVEKMRVYVTKHGFFDEAPLKVRTKVDDYQIEHLTLGLFNHEVRRWIPWDILREKWRREWEEEQAKKRREEEESEEDFS